MRWCTNPNFEEYDATATVDDGSCVTPNAYAGCTDPAYFEYDPYASEDDGSCTFLSAGYCTAPAAFDGYTYEVVAIGGQCWFAENLRTTTYANGDPVPSGLTETEWGTLTTGATTVYGEGDLDCVSNAPFDACNENLALENYGRLYNAYAAMDERGLCPAGWHVPTRSDWNVLLEVVGQGYPESGTALKSTSGWNYNGYGTDDVGFAGLPGGYRLEPDLSFGSITDRAFLSAGESGVWWSSTPGFGCYNWSLNLGAFSTDASMDAAYSNQHGLSVRCVKDAQALGCTDSEACNYDPDATDPEGLCLYPVEGYDCDGVCFDVDSNCVCDVDDILGCIFPLACNYNPEATTDDGSCALADALGECGGDCAADADGDGLCDDVDNCVGTLDACGVCNGPGEVFECGCSGIAEGFCDCAGNTIDAVGECGGTCTADADGDGICDDVDDCVGTLDVCGVCNGNGGCVGCTYEGASNYDLGATIDDGSCVFEAPPVVGCTDATACNYNAQAVSDDGTCYFAPAEYGCDGQCLSDEDGDGICDAFEGSACAQDLNGDGVVTVADLVLFLGSFAQTCEEIEAGQN